MKRKRKSPTLLEECKFYWQALFINNWLATILLCQLRLPTVQSQTRGCQVVWHVGGGGLAERQVRAWQGQSGADSDSVTRDSQSPVSNITLWTTLQHAHTYKSDLKPFLPKQITFGVLQSYALINASYSTSTVQKTADVAFISPNPHYHDHHRHHPHDHLPN